MPIAGAACSFATLWTTVERRSDDGPDSKEEEEEEEVFIYLFVVFLIFFIYFTAFVCLLGSVFYNWLLHEVVVLVGVASLW